MGCRTEASSTLIVVSTVQDGHLQDGCRRQRDSRLRLVAVRNGAVRNARSRPLPLLSAAWGLWLEIVLLLG